MIVARMVLALALAADLQAAEFIFVNGDGPGEGLNDSTPATPVGGNPGTTRGAQRLAVLQRAGEIWGSFLVSAVPIRVSVEFDALGASTLAQAGAETLEQNFPNAPRPNVWYAGALANSLAGTDLDPARVDIAVTANSNGAFYYGLDSASPGGLANFVDVLLHELGHGLGFISLVDVNTGNLFGGQADAFSSLIFDRELNAAWPALTATARFSSARNDPALAWSGAFTTAGAPAKLTPQMSGGAFRLIARFPDGTSRQLGYLDAEFDAAIPAAGVDELLVPTAPANACGPLLNAAQLAGNVAFIRRGSCDFDSKVFAAQQAGAVAVVIANNVASGVILPGGDSVVDGQPVNFTIPAVFVSRQDGDDLLAAPPGLSIALEPIVNSLAGSVGPQVRLHAPVGASAGSSVSHWTTAASPNLLMEPIINPNLDRKLDLTLTQMKDIGWKVIGIPFPHFTFAAWQTDVFGPGALLTGPGDDPDADGVENLEEYFFGNDPLKPDAGRLPVFRFVAGQGDLVFTRSKLPADLRYVLEKSTDLVGFSPAVVGVDYSVPSTISLGTDAEEVTLRLLAPPTLLFLRLRIETQQ